jgi:RND family efflux transporter MFP subunit
MKLVFLCRPLAAVLLASWLPYAFAADIVSVQVVTPDRGEVLRYAALPGTLIADRQAIIYAKVAGYLRTLTVDKGDNVSAGQVIGELEMPELKADADRFAALVKVAEHDYERLVAAQKQAPDLVTPLAVDEAQGRMETARADLNRSKQLLNYARLTAPFDGIVTMRHVDPGAYVPAATSGASAATAAIVTVMDIKHLRVQVPVPERDAVHVSAGQPVRLHVEGLPQVFQASVSRHSFAIDPATRTMLVEADLANPDRILRPGMYAHAEIGVERHTGVLRVPSAALRSERNGDAVFVMGDNKVRRVAVKTGFNDGSHVEIVEGLSGSETVAIPASGTLLSDGQPVIRSETP